MYRRRRQVLNETYVRSTRSGHPLLKPSMGFGLSFRHAADAGCGRQAVRSAMTHRCIVTAMSSNGLLGGSVATRFEKLALNYLAFDWFGRLHHQYRYPELSDRAYLTNYFTHINQITIIAKINANII